MTRQIKIIAAMAALMVGAAFLAAPAFADDASSAAPTSAAPESGIHAGDWLVRLRAISIVPQTSTSSNSVLNAISAGVNNSVVPELDFTYMITDSIGAELILGTSRNQVTSSLGNLGGVGVLPPTLLLQYHFNHAGTIRPYVGAGLNYTLFYNNGLHVGSESVGIENHSFGPALQIGVDVDVAKNVFLNVDLKKIWMHTTATLGSTPLGTLDIDPLIVGAGIGYRF